MSALATFTGSAVPAQSSVSALRNLGSTAKKGSNAYLTFTKYGVWHFGVDKLEVEPEDEFAVNPNSFKCGYIAWANKKVVGEKMNPIQDGMPDNLDEGMEWNDQLAVSLKQMNDDQVEMEYKTSTVGGKQAVAELADAIANRAESDPESCIPLVNCITDSYDHKQYGKIFKPVLSVVGWLDGEGNVVERC